MSMPDILPLNTAPTASDDSLSSEDEQQQQRQEITTTSSTKSQLFATSKNKKNLKVKVAIAALALVTLVIGLSVGLSVGLTSSKKNDANSISGADTDASTPSRTTSKVPTYEPTTYETYQPTTDEDTTSAEEKVYEKFEWTTEEEDEEPTSEPTYKPTTLEPTPETSSLEPSTTYPTFSPNAIADDKTADNSIMPDPLLGEVTFRRGDLAVINRRLGIKLCTGMSAKMIAKAGQHIPLQDGSYSTIPFHSMADGAAIFPVSNDNDGSYVYVSNSEMYEAKGGVGALYFDKDGNIVDYKELLMGTTRNCGGGRTPWNTWVTCEEYANGQCWQVDPEDTTPPQVTKLGGSGGKYESVAVDNRNERQPIFFVTEDHKYGALRKYTPPSTAVANWDTLHVDGGTTEFLVFINDYEFEWYSDEDAARESQNYYYRNVEGIDFQDGYLYFVSKKEYLLFILDLDAGTYTTSSTEWGVMANGGEFEYQPDQIVRNDSGEYLYITEDGGKTAGVYAVHRATGSRYAIFEAYANKYRGDETTGLAFSPDGTKMYAAFQDCGCEESGCDDDCGCLMEFRRDDGRSFDGSTLSLKFHSSAEE